MGVRENKVETYLHDCVTRLGGTTRKWVGRKGVPDRVVIVPGATWLVEVKTTDGALSPEQQREHKRLRDAGATVRTVYGHAGVDELIEELKHVK